MFSKRGLLFREYLKAKMHMLLKPAADSHDSHDSDC